MLMVWSVAVVAEDHLIVTWTPSSAADMAEICLIHRPSFPCGAYLDVSIYCARLMGGGMTLCRLELLGCMDFSSIFRFDPGTSVFSHVVLL